MFFVCFSKMFVKKNVLKLCVFFRNHQFNFFFKDFIRLDIDGRWENVVRSAIDGDENDVLLCSK